MLSNETKELKQRIVDQIGKSEIQAKEINRRLADPKLQLPENRECKELILSAMSYSVSGLAAAKTALKELEELEKGLNP